MMIKEWDHCLKQRILSLKDADHEQSNFSGKTKNLVRVKKIEKVFFK